MEDCDADTSVPDWLIDHPECESVMRRFGLDASCGGQSLATACRRRGCSVAIVLSELQRVLADSARDQGSGQTPRR